MEVISEGSLNGLPNGLSFQAALAGVAFINRAVDVLGYGRTEIEAALSWQVDAGEGWLLAVNGLSSIPDGVAKAIQRAVEDVNAVLRAHNDYSLEFGAGELVLVRAT